VNPWLRVDLGQTRELQTCEILWDGPAKYYKYKLEGSIDGQTWTALGDQSTAVPTSPDSPSELSRMNISGSRLRYLRITILAGKSLGVAEIRAFGPEL
jgi:alpha-L-fucosidase